MRIMLTPTTFDHTNKDGHLGQYMELIVDAYQGTPVLLNVNHEGTIYGHACTLTAYLPATGTMPARVQITEYGHSVPRTVRCKNITAVTALPDPTATARDNMIATDPAGAALDAHRQHAATYRYAWHAAYDALEAAAAAVTAKDQEGLAQALGDYRQACQQHPRLKAVLADVKTGALKGYQGGLTRMRPRLAPTA